MTHTKASGVFIIAKKFYNTFLTTNLYIHELNLGTPANWNKVGRVFF